jgi:hypothetical protein
MPSSVTVSRPRRRAVGALACALFVAGHAVAQDTVPPPVTPDKKAVAEALFSRAKALDEAGKYAEACPLFAESQRIDPGLGTMLWLADCYESNGQTASAWAQFREAIGVAALRKDPREKVAQARSAALEPKVSKLTVQVPAAVVVPGLEIRRDGVPLSQAEWGLSLPIDPGAHTFTAVAPGHKPWSSTLQVGTVASASTQEVPPLEVAPEPLLPGSSPAPVAVPLWGTQRVAGLAAGAAGVVALGIGGYFSLHAKSTYDASNQNGLCNSNNQCNPTGQQDRTDAQSAAGVATVMMIAGGVVLAGGAVLFFTAPRATSTRTGVQVTPLVGPGEAGLGLRGAF